MKWSILIATTLDRRDMFFALENQLKKQIAHHGLINQVQVLHIEDEKGISVGLKRLFLLHMSRAEYINFFDSDDLPAEDYVIEIFTALKQNPDCVGFKIHMTTNGAKPQTCCHSLKYPEWKNNVDGFDFVRNVTHFNPVRRELAIKVGFEDKRFGEDKTYSDKVTQLCKNEIFIDKKLFHYRFSNTQKHQEKYGI